jgi:DNA-binding phage protein
MRVLEVEDVVHLLRSKVERAGGQSAWAKKAGVDRTVVNRILHGARRPTEKIISALNLRMVFVSEPKSPHSK